MKPGARRGKAPGSAGGEKKGHNNQNRGSPQKKGSSMRRQPINGGTRPRGNIELAKGSNCEEAFTLGKKK